MNGSETASQVSQCLSGLNLTLQVIQVDNRVRNERFVLHPSCDRLGIGLLVVFVVLSFFWFANDGFHVRPIAAGIEHDEFVSASGLAELRGIAAGRNPDGLFVDERASLALSSGQRRQQQECDSKNEQAQFHV